jgi:hypothetical protein
MRSEKCKVATGSPFCNLQFAFFNLHSPSLARPFASARPDPLHPFTPSPRHRRGFTLAELAVAVASVSVLVMGMASAVMMARQAVPDATKGSSASLSAAAAMDRLSADLSYATSIVTSSANELVFLVADRNSDGNPETIRYSWSGTPGGSLVRQVNGGPQATLLAGVQEFSLNYQKRSQPLPTSYSDGAETLLASYDSGSTDTVFMSRNTWCGEYFRPTLPAQATSWRVTRVQFSARQSGPPTEEIRVQLRPALGIGPADSVLADISLMENTLGTSFGWTNVAVSGVSGLPPGTGLCLVVKGLADVNACAVRYQANYAYAPNCNYIASNDGGNSWSTQFFSQMPIRIYGTVSTPNPAQSCYLLTGVQATLRSGSDAASRVQASIQVPNRPQVPGP